MIDQAVLINLSGFFIYYLQTDQHKKEKVLLMFTLPETVLNLILYFLLLCFVNSLINVNKHGCSISFGIWKVITLIHSRYVGAWHCMLVFNDDFTLLLYLQISCSLFSWVFNPKIFRIDGLHGWILMAAWLHYSIVWHYALCVQSTSTVCCFMFFYNF